MEYNSWSLLREWNGFLNISTNGNFSKPLSTTLPWVKKSQAFPFQKLKAFNWDFEPIFDCLVFHKPDFREQLKNITHKKRFFWPWTVSNLENFYVLFFGWSIAEPSKDLALPFFLLLLLSWFIFLFFYSVVLQFFFFLLNLVRFFYNCKWD